MTEQELEILRLKMQIHALQVLVTMLYTSLAQSSPNAPQDLREKFASLRSDHDQIVVKGLKPGYSDLIAGEYQEALDDLLKLIESKLKK